MRRLHGYAGCLRCPSAAIQPFGARFNFQRQEEKVSSSSQFGAPVFPESAHAPTYFRNPGLARSRRLLPGPAQWQMGLEHRIRAAKISVGQRHEPQRQARRSQPAKTGPGLEHRRCGRAQAAIAHQPRSHQHDVHVRLSGRASSGFRRSASNRLQRLRHASPDPGKLVVYNRQTSAALNPIGSAFAAAHFSAPSVSWQYRSRSQYPLIATKLVECGGEPRGICPHASVRPNRSQV